MDESNDFLAEIFAELDKEGRKENNFKKIDEVQEDKEISSKLDKLMKIYNELKIH